MNNNTKVKEVVPVKGISANAAKQLIKPHRKSLKQTSLRNILDSVNNNNTKVNKVVNKGVYYAKKTYYKSSDKPN
jgi:hypothetical protein